MTGVRPDELDGNLVLIPAVAASGSAVGRPLPTFKATFFAGVRE
jgi:hypothetical protein